MSGILAAKKTATDIWRSLALPESALSLLKLTGDSDSAINSTFRLGTAAQVSIGLAGLASAQFYALRTATKLDQEVIVDARHAVISFHGEAWYTLNGNFPEGNLWDTIAGLYKTKGGGFVRIHTNFPHHRKGILEILEITDTPDVTREDVSKALLQWDAIEFETRAALSNMCATALRSFDVWDSHPHAKALLEAAPVSLMKIGEAPKRQIRPYVSHALDEIRVLDLSRVLAGPVAGRTLATYGADVLFVTSPNLPSLPFLDTETSMGKRTTQLDLTTNADREKLTDLAREADVFLQTYRPGGLKEKGFGVKELAMLHPGIISANLTAWGWDGPWKDRRGFDSLVQTAAGFNAAEGQAYHDFSGEDVITPRPFPMQAIDHAAGYLLTLGINAALCKTITEGGSWEVRVSLAAVGQWIRSLGRLSPEEAFGKGRPFPPRVLPPDPEIQALSTQWQGTKGEMTAIRHAAIFSKMPVKEGLESAAPMGLDVHAPMWQQFQERI